MAARLGPAYAASGARMTQADVLANFARQGRGANDEAEVRFEEVTPMAKKSRGGRMTAAKGRAAKRPGGKGPVKNRRAGKRIMST